MLPKLFSKMRIGKGNSSSKHGYLCGHSRNFSDDDDDDDDDLRSLGCLSRYSPGKNSKSGSVQNLDKLSEKRNGGMKPAVSMIDLNAKKSKNLSNSARGKPMFKKDDGKADYEGITKEQKKDLKRKHKEDRLKRGYSWRQAYKTGAIPLENKAGKDDPPKDSKNMQKDLKERKKDSTNRPKAPKNDIFSYDNSLNSSSVLSETSRSGSAGQRDSKTDSVVNRYSSTLHIFKAPDHKNLSSDNNNNNNNNNNSSIINNNNNNHHHHYHHNHNNNHNNNNQDNNNNNDKCNKSLDKPDGHRFSRSALTAVKSLDLYQEADMNTQVPPASVVSSSSLSPSSSSSSSTISSADNKLERSTDKARPIFHTTPTSAEVRNRPDTARSVFFVAQNENNNDIIGGLKGGIKKPTNPAERKGPLKQTDVPSTPNHLAKSNPHISNRQTPDRISSADNLSRKNKQRKDDGRFKLSSSQKTHKEPTNSIYDSKSKTSYFKGNLLGKGGFARCYELIDMKSKKKYAGKIISKNSLNKSNQMEKIKKEIELHKSLTHKHVVAFHSCFEDPANVIIVLEYCSMKSLVHMLKRRKFLTEPEVRYFMAQLITGVQYIHSRNVIHRDLKLGNMLLNSLMHLKIADFGLAARVTYAGERKTDVCGTPNYIAPEVLQKRGHSYEADVWALGCIMFALLCGRPPFETATLKETYLRITVRKYNTPLHVSTTAKNLIKSLLSLDPLHRPALEKITKHSFFFDGFFPQELSPSTCEIQPKFPLIAIDKTAFNNLNRETGNLAQSKNTRKSASQVITRVKTTEYESHDLNSNLKDDHSVGNAPSTPRAPDQSAPMKHPTTTQLFNALKPHISLLVAQLSDPLPEGAITSNNQAHTRHNRYVCVTKWIDYSDKYGFSYQLSNGCVGVLFNDHTRMLLLNDNSTVIVEATTDDRLSFKHTNTPPHLAKKTNLLLFFAQFMEANLISGGSNHNSGADKQVFLRHWFRTHTAIVMSLSDATVQVNFIEDHTKIVFSLSDEIWVTLVDSNRRPATYPLKSLPAMGCHGEVVKRLQYASEMVGRVVEEDGGGRRNSKAGDL